ncbi:PepSY-associated TM helix domain-containing protein [Aquariibacter albus]|uniref:PepSY domain-containing protein n=1 Tax=Aquariibacter albus TaxID=2759899 RepID=A0A839HQE5_9BURK|nr:PepSY-associated TM helix domain-containing protein [Aquariibacter albus]MBB1161808.1 PepSY domain-containing protein [Aquariibacter albus]
MSRARRLWLRLHRWLGLGLALWFVLVGLTGSVLAFYPELDALLDTRLARREGAPPMTLEQAYAALQAAHPQRGPGWRLEIPQAPGEPLTARYLRPAETRGQGFAPLLATVDPATRQVVLNRFWGQHLTTWVYDLHYSLLLGKHGVTAVGIGGGLMMVSLLSGLWLWWPRGGGWRAAWRLKLRGAAPARRHHDLHKLGGWLALPLLGMLAFSGLLLALPHWTQPVIAAFSPLTPLPSVPQGFPEPRRLSVDQAVAVAEAAWPGARARWVDPPAEAGSPWRVRLRQPDEPGVRFPATLVWIDDASGEIVAARDPRAFTAGDVFWQWMHPLHMGEAFGLPGRAGVAAAGLLPLLLAWTGWRRWRDKRRARKVGATRRGATRGGSGTAVGGRQGS